MSTIGQIYVAAKEGIEDKRAERDQYTCFIPVYDKNKRGEEFIKEISAVDYVEFIRILRWLGFRRYDVGNGYNLVRIVNNVVEIVEMRNIIDTFIEHIKAMPADHFLSEAQNKVLNKIIGSLANLFSKEKLQLLYDPSEKFIFNTDTEKEAFFYFQNGFITVTAKGLHFAPYRKLPTYKRYHNGDVEDVPKVIWKSQILQHDFKLIPSDAYKKHDWYLFLQNVSQKETPERLTNLMQLLGYIMHAYMDKKRKAFILTDSSVGLNAEGRSGKTLLGKAVQFFLNADKYSQIAAEMNGKDFKHDNPFKYQMLDVNTRVVILNDVKRNFKMEGLFNDITEGLERQRKTELPVKVYAKFMIPTNQTIELPSGSAKDRAIEFELSNHYSAAWQPMDDFKRYFFTDWEASDWQTFHNIMLECVCVFLEKGLPTIVKSINLEKRKLLDETSQDFIDFMAMKFLEGEETNRITLIPFEDKEWRKNHAGQDSKALFEEFCTFAGEVSNKGLSLKFATYLKKYVLYSDFITKLEDPRSNSIKKYYFFANEIKEKL